MPPSQSNYKELTAADLPLFTVLLVVDSLHFIFARALLPHISPMVSAMYVIGIATVQVGLYGLYLRARKCPGIRIGHARKHVGFFLIVGFLVAGSTVLNYLSVAFIDAGTASILGKMTTLWSLAFSLIWLHERLTPRQIAGATLTIIGVFIIAFQPGDYLRLGSLMIVTSTLMYALHAAVVKRSGEQMDLLSFFFFRLLFTTVFLFLFAVGARALVWPTPYTWALLLVAGTVDVTISRALYYGALRRLPMSVHAIILTVSPVIAIGWSLLLFGTFPGPRELLGGLAVLLGVLLATFQKR